MKGYVALTDEDWFTFLRDRQPLDEVNFWQPSAHGFRAPAGTPFFFKLKAPRNAIGGFGVFARYEEASPTLAWEAFGERNGAPTFRDMWERVGRYAKRPGTPAHRIGCIMVSDPVFFPPEEWIAQPRDWKPNIVSGAGIDLASGEGLRIWEACMARRAHANLVPIAAEATALPGASGQGPRFGSPQLVRPRLGQGTFRVAVTAAYGGACAVSGEHSLPALEAAHIRPYTDDGPHDVANGLLLRADIHRLFDAGYVTVTPELRFVVSERLATEWENGKIYYERNGGSIAIPKRKLDRPDPALLRWHNENVFEKGLAA